MGFLAWRRADAIGHCLDSALAILAALGAQALHAADRPPPPALAPLVDEVRAVFSPVEAVRPLGPDGDALASAFAQRVFRGPVAAADIARS
jgi:histidine ammonia-lyase